MPRPLNEIAQDIKRDWLKPYFGARPYLDAMQYLKTINDFYYADSAYSVISYFLANAQTWKGENARKIKVELNALIA